MDSKKEEDLALLEFVLINDGHKTERIHKRGRTLLLSMDGQKLE